MSLITVLRIRRMKQLKNMVQFAAGFRQKGKGMLSVTCLSMFQQIFIFWLTGMTLNASESRLLVKEIENGADMAVGERQQFKNVLYKAANLFLRRYVRRLFRLENNIDIISGYRAFNKKFIKSCVDLDSNGMDVDTEYTLKAVKDKKKIVSVPVSYKKRNGSRSKYNPVIDSLLVLNCISVVFWGAERKGK